MGGDHAPESVLYGAAEALTRHAGLHFHLFGDEARIAPVLAALPALKEASTLHHTARVIASDEQPSVALRKGKDSSMRLAIDCVHAGKAAAVVSAGNTGALMAMAKIVFRTLPGIDRPAIASFFPTEEGKCVFLDMGANIECDAKHLFQFAIMGDAFARAVLGLESPKIGLLNVGEEDMKGHEAVKEAAAMLKHSGLPLNFYGFIEGDDIAAGTVDVVVTDGFTGNIVIKTAEGVARMLAHKAKGALRNSLLAKLGLLLALPAIRRIKDHLNPSRYNGAMFLGLNGIAVKSHGGTDSEGFANAIGVAVEIATHGLNRKIIEELQSTNGGIMANGNGNGSNTGSSNGSPTDPDTSGLVLA